MSERKHSVDKKNRSRPKAGDYGYVSSAQKRKKTKTDTKYEVTCARCRFTKEWSQKQWDSHMWKVHQFMNEIRIGSAPKNLFKV